MNDPIAIAASSGFLGGLTVGIIFTTVIFRNHLIEGVRAMKAILAVPVTPIDGERNGDLD